MPLEEDTGDTRFSRGKGLHVGALQATREASDLIFFCDVDVLMELDFFTRCRANTLLGRQVSDGRVLGEVKWVCVCMGVLI